MKSYKVLFKCRNCYRHFTNKIPFGIDMRTSDDACWYEENKKEHVIVCPGCGSEKIRRVVS